MRTGIRLGLIAAVVVTMITSGRLNPSHEHAIANLILLVLSVGGSFIATGERGRWMPRTGYALTSVAGAALTVLAPDSAVIALPAMAVFAAAGRLPLRESFVIMVAGVGVNVGLFFLLRRDSPPILLYSLMPAGLWVAGIGRRQYAERAEQAELLLSETRRASQASAKAAALAERARIAREIHDILAHSLSALSLRLQAADGLLADSSLPADHPALAKLRGCLAAAGALAREGLDETRRAVHALRTDDTPLPELLESLVDSRKGQPVRLRVIGAQRTLPAEVSLTLYRAIQEALTNAGKHAPGAPVDVTLDYGGDSMRVDIRNPLPDNNIRQVKPTGAGYGIAGLRERIELLGGELSAGPSGADWVVSVRIAR
ncbi:MAG: hypothetical protein J2O49_03715 [Sciscionella sp.]|nr:hypothetical protein [Sciscionella sp.]